MANHWEYDYSQLYNRTKQDNQEQDAATQQASGHYVPPMYQQAQGQGQASPPPPPSYASSTPPAPSVKKRGTGKRIAAGALAVVLCGGVGFGGGYLGSLAANGRNTPNFSAQQPAATDNGTVSPPAASADGMSIAQVASLVGPSVVEVRTEQVTTNPLFGQYVTDGAGSGVIISQDGYVITNNHVVAGASQIVVTLQDKTEYPATLIGSDSKTDIAVLKIEGTGLTAAALGNSDSLTVGEFALAVGNPMGQLGGTVTDGIISALNRDVTVGGETMTLMQTNAAVSPGNSGGGLFNSKGELIGVVNAKSSGADTEGLGFAIPINTAISIAQELIDNGYVTGRPALGISVISVEDAQTAMQYGVTRAGVYIADVTKGGAAEKAGLQVGDMFVSVDGTAVSQTSDVTGALDGRSAGEKVEVQVVREGKIVTVSVTLQEKEKPAIEEAAEAPTQTLPRFGGSFNG